MKTAIGIDLGTTYSAIAIMQDGKPTILPNIEGQNITPSVVLFPSTDSGEEPLVGEMAKRSASTAPLDVVQFVKRQMGDPNWRFESTNGNSYSAEEISAVILKKLKNDAETALGKSVTDVVITVPAYFDDARRIATKQAGEIAGMHVLRVLNEPTAAAMSYGLSQDKKGTVLVYDLGGGTFDVTIMEVNNGMFDVLATDGNRNLGGFDFDNRIAEYVFEQIKEQGINRDVRMDDLLVAEIREKAEIAKKSLTTVAQTTIMLTVDGKNIRIKMTRDEFESRTEDLLNTTKELVEDAMENAGKSWSDINHLLLVGGSTRMPMVKKMMASLSGKNPELNVNPDEAVALGAAIQAYISVNEVSGIEEQGNGNGNGVPMVIGGEQITINVSDVTSQALGVILLNDNEQDENYVVIPKNAKIPTKGNQRAKTIVDQQTAILVRVTQGEDREARYVTIIGSKEIPIPPYPKGAPFTVSYAYDIDQTVYVELFDDTKGTVVGKFEIDRLMNLDEEEVKNAMQRIEQMDIQ